VRDVDGVIDVVKRIDVTVDDVEHDLVGVISRFHRLEMK
jgi:hypothetical protein